MTSFARIGMGLGARSLQDLKDVSIESEKIIFGNTTTLAILPRNNNHADLGSSNKKFKDVHIENTVYASKLNNGANMTIPTNIGTLGQVMTTDGVGTLSWGTVSTQPTMYHITTEFPGDSGRKDYSAVTGNINILIDVASWATDNGSKAGNQIQIPEATSAHLGQVITVDCIKSTSADGDRQLRVGLLSSSSTNIQGGGTIKNNQNTNIRELTRETGQKTVCARIHAQGMGLVGTKFTLRYVALNIIIAEIEGWATHNNPGGGQVLQTAGINQQAI